MQITVRAYPGQSGLVGFQRNSDRNPVQGSFDLGKCDGADIVRSFEISPLKSN